MGLLTLPFSTFLLVFFLLRWSPSNFILSSIYSFLSHSYLNKFLLTYFLKSGKMIKIHFLNLSESQIVGFSFHAKIKLIGATNNCLLRVVLSYLKGNSYKNLATCSVCHCMPVQSISFQHHLNQ